MSDAQLNASKVLRHWVSILRLGNDPTPQAWLAILAVISRMPDDEKEAMSALLLDLLNELDHGKN